MPANDQRLIQEAQLKVLNEILRTLNSIEQYLRPDGAAVGIEIYNLNGSQERIDHMFDLVIDQNLPLKVVIKDKKGNPAKVDGAPKWSLNDASLAALEVAEDGFSGLLKPAGLVGLAELTIEADADLGEGVKPISKTVQINLVALGADSVDVEFGEPVPQDAPPA